MSGQEGTYQMSNHYVYPYSCLVYEIIKQNVPDTIGCGLINGSIVSLFIF